MEHGREQRLLKKGQRVQGSGDLPCGQVVKNLPANAGDTSLILGLGTKIPHAAGQLNLCTTTTEPAL